MRKSTIICDLCGKETTEEYFKIDYNIKSFNGYDCEDSFIERYLDDDLCKTCMEKWLNACKEILREPYSK